MIEPRRCAVGERLIVVNGHPDPRPKRFCAALARAYAMGARKAAAPGG